METTSADVDHPGPPRGSGIVAHREDCVLGPLLERRARQHPDRIYATFDDGRSLTYEQMLTEARAVAVGLSELGVEQGDTVVVWLPTGYDALRIWFGINLLGAIYVPINTAYRGRLLEHVLENSGARVMVAHPDLADRLRDVPVAELRQVVVLGDAPDVTGVEILPGATLDGDPRAHRPPPVPVEPWDTQSIIYTSGTTGPSKGVLSSYHHLYTSATVASGPLSEDDRYLLTLPLFHAGGTITAYGMLVLGASLAVVSAFETARFWDHVREHRVTACTLLGAMASFLLKRDVHPGDRATPLRRVWIVPLTQDALDFGERFDVEVRTTFNMSEVSVPLISEVDPRALGSCGRLRSGVEARLVDEQDRPVAIGEPGELILRADAPWTMFHGYHRMPEATVEAWRNGWFHTGDLLRVDEEGDYYFVDRRKDALRRRGENISSFEVEAEITALSNVREAAVVAVPSEHGEDEVLAIVAPVPGASIDPGQLIGVLQDRLPHFMVPRYVRVLDELPRTPTAKIEKYRLRSEGLTAETWDREAAGIEVRRTVLR